VTTSYRTIIAVLVATALLAVVAACSSNDKPDDASTSTSQPVANPTARPTTTPSPTATSTPGPTATPGPTSTPEPTPTATSTPEPPESHVEEMGRLFSELGIDFTTLSLASVKAAQWPTSALGCPEPGTYYDTSDAPYTGLEYTITNGSIDWEYHTNSDDSNTVRCSEVTPSNAALINLAEQANLDEAKKLTLMRKDFSTGEFVVRREMTPHDMARLAGIFSQESRLSYAAPCESVFRLDFETNRGVSQIEFICRDNYQAFDIYWNELHGNAPIIGKIVGPYLTGDPIPQLPTATP